MIKLFNKQHFLLLIFFLIIISSITLRFYDLNWGAPFYFHPDERNVASGISRLNFPTNMNPEFFAYGSLPIYTTYFIGVFVNLISNIFIPEQNITKVSFEQAIIILRTLSAILSVGIIFLIFDLTKKSINFKYAVLASTLTGLNVGLIQYSHFGTYEIWLTFLFILLLKSLYEYVNSEKVLWIVFSGLILGFLLSLKVSSIIILPVVLFTFWFCKFKTKNDYKKILKYINFLISFFLVILISFLAFLFTSPFVLLDYSSFAESIGYESSVALGNINVFYIGGFPNTIPVIYQLLFVYPFIFNPANLILSLILLPLVFIRVASKKELMLKLTIVFFIFIFFSQAFFYVKWIRYYVPTIPFLIITLVFGLKSSIDLIQKKYRNIAFNIIFVVLTVVAFIYSFSYFKTVLLNTDTRIEAFEFAEKNIPKDSRIISEVYDLGIVPFNSSFSNITLFDFYGLDDEWNKKIKREELDTLISNSEYFIVPSQRIIRNRIINADSFPEGNTFYKNINNKFKLIYKTPCDVFCRILYLGDPIYLTEETASVFDRPTIHIYKLEK